ncbi:hypothetical protein [Actinomadura sp. NTSP31]|uniref:hypothetical protein n=1 Tax=Actinomadura sp. NTSP31 TaxID=1735447 RepID=UPI0035BFF71A
MPKFAITSVVLSCALLAGCSSTSGAAAPTVSTPKPTGPPADGGYFTEPREIVAKSDGAIPCADLKETANPVGARAQVTCSGENIVVRVHENGEGVQDQVDLMKLTGGDLLLGQNWTVNAGPTVLKAAQLHLGGRITHIPCTPPDCALAGS